MCGCEKLRKPTCVQSCLQDCTSTMEICLSDCNCPCEPACQQICLRNNLGDDCLSTCGCMNLVSKEYLGKFDAKY